MSNDKLSQLSEKVGSVRNLISNFEGSNQQNCSNHEQTKTEQNDIECPNLTVPTNEPQVEEFPDNEIPDLSVDSSKREYQNIEQLCSIEDKKQFLEANNKMTIVAATENMAECKSYSSGKYESSTTNGILDNEPDSISNEMSPPAEASYVVETSQENSSSVYSNQEKASEENFPENHESSLPEANDKTFGIESLNSKETSDWDSGNFLKQFGIESKTDGFIDSGTLSDRNVFPNGESINYNNEAHTLSDSVKTKDSTLKSFVDMSWNLGDIDALEKIPKEPKSRQVPSAENNESLGNDVSRKRSVSFSEEKNNIYYLDPNVIEKDPADNNPWKYVCYGILIAVLSFYVITITFKEFVTQQKPTILVTESDVLGFFNGSSNHTRDYILNKLIQEYNISPLETMLPTARSRRMSYSPRHDDHKIKSVYNSFENINSEFHDDYDIRQLMENDDLKFMFAGMAYAPENVIEPECGASYREVLLDVARLSSITGKLRTYGTQCQQAEYILEAIKDLNLNMTLALGVWICDDDEVNQKQLKEMKRLLTVYPSYLIDSVFIGNEVLYREDRSVDELLGYINETKNYLKDMNITNVMVGTSEMGSKITPKLFSVCDFVGANIHPFFSGVEAQFGTRWVLDYYYNSLLPQSPHNDTQEVFISEVGWPYRGGEFDKAVAGSWEFQQFLNDWLCTTPAEILNNCYYFEAYDESWKKIWWKENHTWETEWGFFDNHRRLKKHIYIPDCSKYGNPAMTDVNYIGDV